MLLPGIFLSWKLKIVPMSLYALAILTALIYNLQTLH